MQAEELVGPDEERCLVCPACGKRYPLDRQTQQQVLSASVRRDPACAGCPHLNDPEPDACLRQSAFLNPLPGHFLVLQSWDLDLDSYLRWQRQEEAPPGREWVWTRLEEHRKAVVSCQLPPSALADSPRKERPDAPVRALWEVVGLGLRIVEAVQQMHARQVVLLNLNPRSVVLNVYGADMEVLIADLCHAHQADTSLSWRQFHLQRGLDTPFAAPECQNPSEQMQARLVRWHGELCELIYEPADGSAEESEPSCCVGDWFVVQHKSLERKCFRVESVWETLPTGDSPREIQIVGRLVQQEERDRAEWIPVVCRTTEDRETEASDIEVFWHKHCGASADIFSVGMILLSLLFPHPEVVSAFRKVLALLRRGLLPEYPGGDGQGEPGERPSPGTLVQSLLEPSAAAGLDGFQSCEAYLAHYHNCRPLAQELLGIVLRATGAR